MRKTISFVIILLISCLLCACQKSSNDKVDIITATPLPVKEKEVTDPVSQNMVESIKTIGEVSLDDEDLINKLLSRYNTLTDSQKEQVWNYIVLIEAEEKLDKLKKNSISDQNSRLKGSWKQINSDDENTYMVAIVDDSTIKVYQTYNNGKVMSLYWQGTYDKPQDLTNQYSWTSKKDKVVAQDYPGTSVDDFKEFYYENNELSFEGAYGDGVKFKIAMTHTDDIVVYDEKYLLENNHNQQEKYWGLKLQASNVYGLDEISEKELIYKAPKALLIILRTELPEALNENNIYSDDVYDTLKENFKENEDYYIHEFTKDECFVIKGKIVRLIGFHMTYCGCKVQDYYQIYYADSDTKSIISFMLTVGDNTTYDYYTDFVEMIKNIK